MSDRTSSFDLSGKTAVVTGANTGIGQAIAIALHAAGARVAAVGRSPMDETAAKIASGPQDFRAIRADLSKKANLQGVVDDAVEWAGGIDILVNNAGITRRAEAVDVTEEDWDAVVDTNLKSVFFLAQAAGRHMIARGSGKIINIASLLSFQGGINVSAYTATKHGVVGVTRILACEWAAKGVNVNAIAPGYVMTNITDALIKDPVRYQAILDRIPAGRWAKPEDIAGAAVFLASSAADYIHGVTLPVDGGWLAR